MSLETATKISELVASNPTGTDPKSQGDDHLRMIKAVLQNNAIKSEIGQSATPANNFSIDASADDGTMKLARESGQDIMTVAANGTVSLPNNQQTVRAAISTTSIPNNLSSLVTFTDEYQDDSNSWNGSRYQPKVDGIYQIIAAISWSAGSTVGERALTIRRNGSLVSQVGAEPSAIATMLETVTLTPMNGTSDYVEVFAFQSSGGALPLNGVLATNRFIANLVQPT